MAKDNNYDASSITVLEGLEAVRKRPGMYIGSVSTKGLNHLIYEIVDNSVDEHLAGYCDTIKVTLEADGSATVEDNGRGIPVGMHEKGISAERLVFTTLHAGGKFDNSAYKTSGGLHGVGSSVVNALSTRLTVRVKTGGCIYEDRYERGNPVLDLVDGLLPIVGKTRETGTTINFLPDDTIFDKTRFKEDEVKSRLHETAYLNPKLTIIFEDKRKEEPEKVTFHEPEGIIGFIKDMNRSKETVHDVIYFSGESDGISVEVAFQYVNEFHENVLGFCNNIYNSEGGTHLTGFKTQFTNVINTYARELNILKEKDANFTGADVRNGMTAVVSIKHPDSEAFIDAKMTEGKVTGANVSVKLDDAFMQAAVDEKPYVQQYPIDSAQPTFTKEIDASTLWKKIVHNAWKSAEPGVLFWDTILKESVPDCYADLGYRTVSTNPCGEIPLCPYDSCRLLAINLYSYVVNPFKPDAYFDFELFKKHVALAQRIMDDIIDLELEKIERIMSKIDADPESEDVKHTERVLWQKIYKKSAQGRRTGVGITAEGDMLAALGLRYGTEEATEFSEQVHKTVALNAYRSSIEMAKERGAFEVYDTEREKNNPFINRLREADPELYENMVKYGRRNIACLTIAPTGTTSLMTQTTSGIEPVFLPVYKRRRKVNPNDPEVHIDFIDETGDAFEEYIVYHHKFLTWMKINGYDTEKRYTQEEIDELVARSPYYKATANDVDWLMKVKMQGAIQKWVDHSISVTVNLPNNVSEGLVAQVYRTAWECGCKGVTVYRDGCRDGVLLEKGSKKKQKCEEHPGQVPKRPKSIPADIVRFKNGTEDWIAFVGLQDGRPYEVFTGKIEEDAMYIPRKINKGFIIKVREDDGTKRYDFQYTDRYGYTNTIGGISRLFDEEFWNYAKLISGVLRHGMPIEKTVSLIESLHLDSESINTWKTGVCRALKQYIVDGTKSKGKCPSCGQENMAYQNGCLTCMSCGYSKCG